MIKKFDNIIFIIDAIILIFLYTIDFDNQLIQTTVTIISFGIIMFNTDIIIAYALKNKEKLFFREKIICVLFAIKVIVYVVLIFKMNEFLLLSVFALKILIDSIFNKVEKETKEDELKKLN